MKGLYISHDLHNFEGEDLQHLKTKYTMKNIEIGTLGQLLKNIIRVPVNVSKADFCYMWFANPASLYTLIWCKIFRKKSIMVSGGYDVVKMKDINYGVYLNPIKGAISTLAFKLVDDILFFSQSSKDDFEKNTGIKGKGHVSYLSVPTKTYKAPKGKKQRAAVTTSTVKWENLKRKGLEPFVKAAKYAPDIEFWLIGAHLDDSIDYLRKIATDNVHFYDYGYNMKKIRERVQKAKVYVQISGHEGFGVAMVEGLLCECVPVVVRRGAIPEVVGDSGVFVKFMDPKDTARGIKKALTMDGKKARKQALKFDTQKRKADILFHVKALLEKETIKTSK